VLDVVYSAIEAVNSQLPPDSRLERQAETRLIGAGSTLDSLGLINFVVACEQAVEDKLGLSISLTDEALMADGEGPLQSVRSLADFLANRISEKTSD
jgi:acyl carrier protein